MFKKIETLIAFLKKIQQMPKKTIFLGLFCFFYHVLLYFIFLINKIKLYLHKLIKIKIGVW